MKLSKVIIENYRGFYGKKTIEFDAHKKGKNINLLIARNDTGKTTFLNSIYWCLYGDEQFYGSMRSNKRIASNKRVMETPTNGKLRVSVSLYFDDEKGPKYEIVRRRSFRRGVDEEGDLKAIQDGPDDFSGLEMNSSGSGFETIEYIESAVNSIIPKGISSFFLLDGEQLKAIFTSDIKHEIKNAIEKVANIDAVTRVIENLARLDKKYSRETSGIDPNFAGLQNEIDNISEKISEKTKEREDAIKRNQSLRKEKQLLNDFLQTHNQEVVSQLASKEQLISEENKRAGTDLIELNDDLNKQVIKTYIIEAVSLTIKTTSEKFEEIIDGGNFPPAFDPVHVLQLLKKKTCICGTKIKEKSDEEAKLIKLSDAKSYTEYVRIISEGGARLPQLISSTKGEIQKITNLKKKINEKENILKQNEKKLQEISEQIKNSDIEEIREKQEQKEELERSITRCESDMARLEIDLIDLAEGKKDAERDLTNIKIKSKKEELIVQKMERCKQMISYAKMVKEGVMKEIKDNIEESTARNFINLHWKAESYKKVTISDDFSLSVKDINGGELVNELSQGAALCFGLAFMTALRKYSGYDVPVIIDSPVGKIDEGNREKIAQELPEQLKDNQVIFLVTNSEYTSVFKKHLENKISTEVNLIYNKETGEVEVK